MDEPITGSANIAVGLLNWLEARKMRKALEAKPPTGKPRRRRESRPKAKAQTSAATLANLELRRQRLALERDKHEWTKVRDIADWFFEVISGDADDEYDDEDDD